MADRCAVGNGVDRRIVLEQSRILPGTATQIETLPGWRDGGVDLGSLGMAVNAITLTLRDSAGLIVWEPHGVSERQAIAKAFGGIVGGLFDGRRWSVALSAAIWNDGSEVPPRELGLRPAFSISARERGITSTAYQIAAARYWWCRKAVLQMAFLHTGITGCQGLIIRRSEREPVRSCLLLQDDASALECALRRCRLAFDYTDHGARLMILSVSLGERNVAAVRGLPRVRQALRKLNQVSPPSCWVGEGIPGWDRPPLLRRA